MKKGKGIFKHLLDINFEYPIFETLIKAIYIFGIVGSFLFAFMMLVLSFSMVSKEISTYFFFHFVDFKGIMEVTQLVLPKIFPFLIIIPFGMIYILFWNRIICEILLLPFNIYNKLQSIDEKLTKEVKEE